MEFDLGFNPSPSPAAPYQPDPRGMRLPEPALPAPVALREEGPLGQALRGLDHLDGGHSAQVQALAERLVALGAETGRPIDLAQATLAAAQALVPASGGSVGIAGMTVDQQADWALKQVRQLQESLPWLPEENVAQSRMRWSLRRWGLHSVGVAVGATLVSAAWALGWGSLHGTLPADGLLGFLTCMCTAFCLLGGMGGVFWTTFFLLLPTPANREARLRTIAKAAFQSLSPEVLAAVDARLGHLNDTLRHPLDEVLGRRDPSSKSGEASR